ncbi:SGNH/GDSL hydrolase family protein [Yeosuana sp. MJ-SS3]|uniref:SGNH/GDSL hydrolase family protein n=1 Tax=Gilvirhabdus luticola TaxID=3079858 RepID=A0ABU3U3K3_9FLAO|nr:SGNH/GDSL hydrolase family protein [Yeosuana sp. MJ-SS3]MDU8884990.1 SGNH/GDSL hydrolase family protein [Yeosuana sp. MJ-SS3]
MKKVLLICSCMICILLSCHGNQDMALSSNINLDNQGNLDDDNDESNTVDNEEEILIKEFKILSLGDSYTIGQSVCETCRFPEQLKDSLINNIANSNYTLDVIAKTGWTTTDLKNAINSQNTSQDYDLVTLLIGVNNQYQNKPFSLYETEFPELLDTAIIHAQGNKNKVIVISIPDYAYTLFGQGISNSEQISEELNHYNDFAKQYSTEKDVTFIYITDITREGLNNPNLVASDDLHPSEFAYSLFVERLLPNAIEKLQ